jgi:hemolysin D
MSAIIKAFPNVATLRDQDIRAFLPAAMEIEQTPASPASRAILWAILVLFTLAVIWAWFGKIDIIATAQGKVIPSERVKTIQPLEAAQIAAIHVREGQQVKKGDPLISLDTTVTEADVRRLTQQWQDAQTQKLRLQVFSDWLLGDRLTLPELPMTSVDPAMQSRLLRQQGLLTQEAQTLNARMSNLKQENARLQAETRMTQAEQVKANRLIEVLRERVAALDILQHKQMGSRAQYLELQQDLIEVEQNSAIQIAKLQQLEAALEANSAQQASLLHEQTTTTLQQLQDISTQVDSLQEETLKAEQRSKQYQITAPIDGTVQQLQVHTLNGVVTPAQELMQIVPADSDLEVEALVLNQDIGFVQENQMAEIKIDTFNFTKYGVIDSKLTTLSTDAITDEHLGLVYKARFTLVADGLQVEDKFVRLSPGMSVTAEIKTGQRRVLEYFLSPLLKAKSESLGER